MNIDFARITSSHTAQRRSNRPIIHAPAAHPPTTPPPKPKKINSTNALKGGRETVIAELKKQATTLQAYEKAITTRIHQLSQKKIINETAPERKELRNALETIQDRSSEVERRLEARRMTQFAINIAHAWGVDTATAQKLTNLDVEVRRATDTGLDAEYDTLENKVTVSQEMIDRFVRPAYDHYVGSKAIDPDTGAILRPEMLKGELYKYGIAVFYPLLSHEAVHMEQNRAGTVEAHYTKLFHVAKEIKKSMFTLRKIDGGSIGEQELREMFNKRFAKECLKLELPAYNRQERDMRALDEHPRLNPWMTIDNTGTNLPQDAAIDNLRGFLLQDPAYQQLEAEMFNEVISKPHPDLEQFLIDIGGRKTPGRKTPGSFLPGTNLGAHVIH